MPDDEVDLSTLGPVLHALSSRYGEQQDSVKSRTVTAPPASPAEGDRYIVPPSATGAWAGHTNEIAVLDSSGWAFWPVTEGSSAWVDDEDQQRTFNGLSWVLTSGTGAVSTQTNKRMPARATAHDGDLACNIALAATPAVGSFVSWSVNGLRITDVGDGTKVGVSCYFSDDGGLTAKARSALAAGDALHWNGSVAGYELATTDVIDLEYEVGGT